MVLLSGQCPYLPALSIPTERTKLTNSPPQGPDHRPPRLLHPRLHQRPPQRTQPGRARPGQGRGPAPVPAAAPAVPAAARVPRPAAAALPRAAPGLPDPVNHDWSESPGADGRACDWCFSKRWRVASGVFWKVGMIPGRACLCLRGQAPALMLG